METVNIIGAGLAGITAAITLAEQGCGCNLISLQPSERAQSVLAEGGINAALDVMGEQDTVREHYLDTMAGGCDLADPDAVRGLTEHAPELVGWLIGLGVPFHRENGLIIQRNFGGQKKKRTVYAKSSTGKVIMSALIDEARRYEAAGLIRRYPHHEFIRLLLGGEAGNSYMGADADGGMGNDSGKGLETGFGIGRKPGEKAGVRPDDEREGEPEPMAAGRRRCVGVRIRDSYSRKLLDCFGTVILACGGMNGMFPGRTTGTTQNSGDVTATVFSQGVMLSNLEMLQYHPTTIGISAKRCLVTEAARGEGGRLFIRQDGIPWYFMEEKYPELKNLMPRDVISREIYAVTRRRNCESQVYLDLTGLSWKVWEEKLSDLREELMHYWGKDPSKEPIPVEPGIHYFMGGIDIDTHHRCSMDGLYAAGECTSQYHGANRLGGNSMLGAIYGGRKAAQDILANHADMRQKEQEAGLRFDDNAERMERREKENRHQSVRELPEEVSELLAREVSPAFAQRLGAILSDGLGIVRSEETLQDALRKVLDMKVDAGNLREKNRLLLAKAMILSALERKESRGAHCREDYPDRDEAFRGLTCAELSGDEVYIRLRRHSERRE